MLRSLRSKLLATALFFRNVQRDNGFPAQNPFEISVRSDAPAQQMMRAGNVLFDQQRDEPARVTGPARQQLSHRWHSLKSARRRVVGWA
jgi:hypothetical protein